MARSESAAAEIAAIMARFDHVVESSKVGVRKPDPAIYRMMCEALGVAASDCVYLDDLGINCKPAAMLGRHALTVTSGEQALTDLSAALGMAPPYTSSPGAMRRAAAASNKRTGPVRVSAQPHRTTNQTADTA